MSGRESPAKPSLVKYRDAIAASIDQTQPDPINIFDVGRLMLASRDPPHRRA